MYDSSARQWVLPRDSAQRMLARAVAMARMAGPELENSAPPAVNHPQPNASVPTRVVCSEQWFWIISERDPNGDPTMGDILRAVSKYFGVPPKDIISRRRTGSAVRPRLACYWLIRTHTKRTFPEMARFISGRDHTTTLKCYRRLDRVRHCDASWAADLAALELALGVKDARNA